MVSQVASALTLLRTYTGLLPCNSTGSTIDGCIPTLSLLFTHYLLISHFLNRPDMCQDNVY